MTAICDADAPVPVDVPADIPADWATPILAFWFNEHGEADWFGGGAAFDAAIAERFAGWIDALRSHPAEDFLTDPQQALAGCILFDQFPRNLYRGLAEAFATDSLALAIARGAVAKGLDTRVERTQAMFFYLPFEHSEDIDDQRESLRLFGTFGDASALRYAERHFAIIKRFGRFPHRNKALGRTDRPGEADAISEGSQW